MDKAWVKEFTIYKNSGGGNRARRSAWVLWTLRTTKINKQQPPPRHYFADAPKSLTFSLEFALATYRAPDREQPLDNTVAT